MLRTRIALALLTALAMALAGSRCHAQTVTVLTSFGNGSGGPSGSLTLSGSTLYGTTVLGGANGEGTVFSIPASGGSPTTLGSFSAAGAYNPYPNGDLLLSGTTLYGMSLNGGVGYGNVFSIPVAARRRTWPRSMATKTSRTAV